MDGKGFEIWKGKRGPGIIRISEFGFRIELKNLFRNQHSEIQN